MAILLLLLCFTGIFLCAGICWHGRITKREIILYAVLIQALLLLIITELLSVFSLLAFTPVAISWLVVFLGLAAFLFKNRNKAKAFALGFWSDSRKTYSNLKPVEKLLIYGIGIISLLVFVQGIIYPPNNWDSLTYHMARIPSWLAQRSLAPFPTHIIRQIYQPPFAEYIIMHAGVLSRSDVFSASVQFFSFVFLLVTMAGIARLLGLVRYYQLLTVFLCATLPEIVLQASSTQNDVVACFFVLTAYYFVIKALRENALRDNVLIGISVGLAIMTKATAYIYLAPVLIYFAIAILVKVIREKRFSNLVYALIAALLVICINTPRTIRNYEASGNIWGTTQQELSTYSNKHFSPGLIASGILKNVGLHLGVISVKQVARAANDAMYQLHKAAHIDINDPGNTFFGTEYSSPLHTEAQEDSAPNFLHFVLITIATVVLAFHFFKGNRNKAMTLLFWIMAAQIIFLCVYLRWQPWNTRLHIPMFMLGCVLIAYAMSISRFCRRVFSIIIPIVFIYCFLIIIRNESRPYDLKIEHGAVGISGTMHPRYQNYFNNKPDYYPEYAAVAQQMRQCAYKNIGLLLAVDDLEYPLFTNCFSETIKPVNIMVNNYTKNCGPPVAAVDCIIARHINKPYIDYNGKRFYNQKTSNKIIYLYK
jgi:hypothetical protein